MRAGGIEVIEIQSPVCDPEPVLAKIAKILGEAGPSFTNSPNPSGG